jgi:tRNA (guanine37-N1)-methyltransferase
MFERFTDRARQVVVLAQEEARAAPRRGRSAPSTCCWRSVRVPGNLALTVLEAHSVTPPDVVRAVDALEARDVSDAESLATLGIDLDEVRRQVEEAFGPGGAGPHPRGPGAGRALARGAHPVREGGQEGAGAGPARGAADEARLPRLRARLLGLLHDGTAARVLRSRGVRQDRHPDHRRGTAQGAPGRLSRAGGAGTIGAVRIDVVTIFPGYLAPLREALLGRAVQAGLVDLAVHDLRTWTHDVHQAVDDAPYGGGPGMVMKPQVWGEALDAVLAADERPARLVVPTPAGRPFRQATAQAWAGEQRLVFACGRYEGIDQRVVDEAAARMPVDEVSIGDYVLVGGEVAVLVMVEAVARLLPGVLGNPVSAEQDSFSDGLLEGPAYTRP